MRATDTAKLAIALTVAIAGSACNASPSPAATASQELPTSRITDLPSNLLYSSLAWIQPHAIVIEAGALGPIGTMGLQVFDPANGRLQPLPVEVQDGCRLQEPGRPIRLPDGRLGYVVHCALDRPPNSFTLYGRDLAGGDVTVLARLGKYNPSLVSYRPELGRAVFGHGSGICAGVALTGLDGVSPLPPTTAGSGSSRFRVDQALTADPCDGTGRADQPAWSPDGGRIALFVSPPLDGVGGLDRVDLPWEIDLMNGSGDPNLTTLLTGVVRPSGLDWSPDGRWLVFSGRLGNQPGTYILEIAGGRVLKIFDQVLSGPVWSPNGQSIAGLLRSQQAPTGGSVVVVDLGPQIR